MLKQHQRGLTLVEVLVAIAILSIAFGILGYLITALRNTASSDEETSAANFSRTYIETLRTKWQIPSEYGRGTNGIQIELPPPPTLFKGYEVRIASYDSALQQASGSEVTFTQTNAANQTTFATYTPPSNFNQDVLRIVAIEFINREEERLTPFVAQIVSPTLTN